MPETVPPDIEIVPGTAVTAAVGGLIPTVGATL
jgi:hypothetical protein